MPAILAEAKSTAQFYESIKTIDPNNQDSTKWCAGDLVEFEGLHYLLVRPNKTYVQIVRNNYSRCVIAKHVTWLHSA